METFETFEEVDDIGQETIGSRWIVTEKEKHDGQKHKYKARFKISRQRTATIR